MSTTNLFVELIVIGIGSVIWVFLLVMSIFGFSWIDPEKLLSLPALIPFLSITYVIGIVVDRIADLFFEWIWEKRLFCRFYKSKEEFYNDRRIIYIKTEQLANLLEYGRSRLRICRGWVLNLAMILLTLNLLFWTRITNLDLKIKLSIFCSLFCITLIYGTWLSWYKMTLNDFRRVKEQANFLRECQ